MGVIARGGEHQPPEFIEHKVCGECGLIPPWCDHDRAKLVVERYVPDEQLRGAVEVAELADAFNWPCRRQGREECEDCTACRMRRALAAWRGQ
jgi:hypothetical protein